MSCKTTYDPCLDGKLNQIGSYASVARQSAQSATTSATQSANSATSAAASAAAAAASAEIAGIYLGPFAVAPTTDNEGGPLQEGMLYYNTVSNGLFVWNGTVWSSADFNEFTNFLATGTTTARNLVTRFSEFSSVKDFGAVGDGAANDTAAFQAFLNSGGGCVPAGTYSVTNLTVPSNTKIWSWENATIIARSGTTNIFNGGNATDITIEGLIIDGNGIAQRGVFFAGLSSERITISNNTIKGVTQDGIWIQQPKYTIVTENIIINPGQHGIVHTVAAERFTISNNLIQDPGGAGIIFSQGNFGAIVGNYIKDGGTFGDCIAGYHQLNSDISIVGNVCDTSTNHGIHVGGSRITVVGNTVLNSTQSGIYISANTGGSSTNPQEPSYNVIVSNNIIDGTTNLFPIFYFGVVGGAISGNSMINAAAANIYLRNSDNISVSNNSIQGGATHGIVLGGSRKCSIQGNLIDLPNQNAVRVESWTTIHSLNNFILNNIAIGGTTAYIEAANGNSNKFVGNTATGYSVQPFAKIGALTTWSLGIPSIDTLASSASLPLIAWGDIFEVTGTTTITSIVSANTWQGRVITLLFKGAITLSNAANIRLNGGVNFVAVSGNTITLMYDGIYFVELSRGTSTSP